MRVDPHDIEILVLNHCTAAPSSSRVSICPKQVSGRMPLNILMRKNRYRKISWLAGILPV